MFHDDTPEIRRNDATTVTEKNNGNNGFLVGWIDLIIRECIDGTMID